MSQKELTRELVNLFRRHRADYHTIVNSCTEARNHLSIKRPSRSKHLPHLLSDIEIQSFYRVIDLAQNIEHQIMLRLLFYTAIRVSELCRIEMGDVNLGGCKIFIDDGKGSKDRYVLFPESFKLVLQSHLAHAALASQRYLFESNRKSRYSRQQIGRIIKRYALEAKIEANPHLFRHQMLTYLTKAGLTDAQLQLISGHSSKKSLEIYQHIGLGEVEGDYQEVVKKLGI